MAEKYLKQALAAMEPKSKAARIRELLPVIEQKIREGVSLRAIVAVLNQGGIELTESTLKSYLYRARKKQAKGVGDGAGISALELGTTRPQGAGDSLSATAPSADQDASNAISRASNAISLQQLDRVMKPDPVQQATELAHYETIAKRQRRSARS